MMFTILPNIGGGSNTLVDPPRSNIGGVRTPVTPAALTPMVTNSGVSHLQLSWKRGTIDYPLVFFLCIPVVVLVLLRSFVMSVLATMSSVSVLLSTAFVFGLVSRPPGTFALVLTLTASTAQPQLFLSPKQEYPNGSNKN